MMRLNPCVGQKEFSSNKSTFLPKKFHDCEEFGASAAPDKKQTPKRLEQVRPFGMPANIQSQDYDLELLSPDFPGCGLSTRKACHGLPRY
jgi:hypothetical protein